MRPLSRAFRPLHRYGNRFFPVDSQAAAVRTPKTRAVPVPVLETPRLRLRGHRSADLPDCVAMWSDPMVTQFITGRASTEQQTWIRLLSYVGHWALHGFGYWAIEEQDSNAFVGEIGFADFRRDVPAPMRNVPELGFALVSRVHEKGYATECVRAVLRWGDAHIPSARTIALASPQNPASLHVLAKCGYEAVDRGVYNDQPVVFFARDAGSTLPS